MCMAIFKPSNVPLPAKMILGDCFAVNPDGAGVAYVDGGVTIKKGLMTYTSFLAAAASIPLSAPAILHCRAATHGTVSPGATHPFPLSDNDDDLFALSLTGEDWAIAHNGIINGYGEGLYPWYYERKRNKRGRFVRAPVAVDKRVLSDTQEFIRDVLSHPEVSAGLIDSDPLAAMIALVTNHSRWVILHRSGRARLVGSWEQVDGCYYSTAIPFATATSATGSQL